MYEIFEKLLEERGVSAYRVAKETGITPSTFAEWKRGTYVPKVEKLQKIADYLNVSVDYFTGANEASESQNPFSGIKGMYVNFTIEIQELGLDKEDLDNILNIYRKMYRRGEKKNDRTKEKKEEKGKR